MITRYILKEFLQVFLVTSLALALVELSVDFIEKIRILYAYSPEWTWLFQYFFFRLLRIFFETLPLILLLSTLITLGGLAKNNEITAFKSAGVSIFRLVTPLLCFGVLVSVASYQLTGTLIPTLVKRSEFIRAVHIEKKKPAGGFVQNKTWLHLDSRRLIYVHVVSPDKQRMQGIHLYELGEDFALKMETEAAELIYENGQWILLNGRRRTFSRDGSVEFDRFERDAIDIPKKPEDFEEATFELKELTYGDLESYVDQLSRAGFDATRYQVDLRGKQAMPFVNAVMVLLGVPFALKDRRSSGIAFGIAVSLAIALSYWLVFSVTLALGRLQVLPPWLAGWSANILILAVSGHLFFNLRQ
ncbi:MAG: LPS export ABC transporter permease LptG [Nitrospiria bacterium]